MKGLASHPAQKNLKQEKNIENQLELVYAFPAD